MNISPLNYPQSGNKIRLPFPIPAWITLRQFGDVKSRLFHSRRSRDEAKQELGLHTKKLFVPRQVHSRDILILNDSYPEAQEFQVDGFLSRDPRAAYGVTVADCLPIYLYTKIGFFGILHSGWKGTGILSHALELLREQPGWKPDETTVLFGPAIGPCCYHVDYDRAQSFARMWGKDTVHMRQNKTYIDLRQANLNQAKAYGVEAVTVLPDCTQCTPVLGSYRREGPDNYTCMLAYLDPEYIE